MCRQKGYTPTREEHVQRWNLEDSSRSYQDEIYYDTSYMQNALTAGLPVITRNDKGQNDSVNAFWGILPVWKHTFKEAIAAATNFVNIRSETVHESKLYAPLLKKKQRCLIPCNYYFEHHHFDEYGKKGQLLKSKVKVPFLLKVLRRPIFSIPALYSHWFDKENKQTYTTVSMLTIVSNDLLSAIHNGGDNPDRMPLVIDREMEERWLDKETSDSDINEILNHQILSEQLSTYTVAPLFGKEARTGEAIIEEKIWSQYKTEIEEIKNTGKQKQPTRAGEMV